MQREFQFYIVPTPIGNLDDISFRALDVLKTVDIIACEDSRVTQNLLNFYNIKTKLISYHKYNERKRVDEMLKFLEEGKKIALVSDAGTPMICDPGNILIKELRERNISLTALSGACSIPVFLSQIPRDNEIFTFIGFFPKTSTVAEKLLSDYTHSNLVFFESPNRIMNTLEFIKNIRGDVKIALSRELTKLYEETVIDSVSNVIQHFSGGLRGEIVCMVYASDSEDIDLSDKIKILKNKGFKSKEISVILSSLFDVNKNDIYKLITDNKKLNNM